MDCGGGGFGVGGGVVEVEHGVHGIVAVDAEADRGPQVLRGHQAFSVRGCSLENSGGSFYTEVHTIMDAWTVMGMKF